MKFNRRNTTLNLISQNDKFSYKKEIFNEIIENHLKQMIIRMQFVVAQVCMFHSCNLFSFGWRLSERVIYVRTWICAVFFLDLYVCLEWSVNGEKSESVILTDFTDHEKFIAFFRILCLNHIDWLVYKLKFSHWKLKKNAILSSSSSTLSFSVAKCWLALYMIRDGKKITAKKKRMSVFLDSHTTHAYTQTHTHTNVYCNLGKFEHERDMQAMRYYFIYQKILWIKTHNIIYDLTNKQQNWRKTKTVIDCEMRGKEKWLFLHLNERRKRKKTFLKTNECSLWKSRRM